MHVGVLWLMRDQVVYNGIPEGPVESEMTSENCCLAKRPVTYRTSSLQMSYYKMRSIKYSFVQNIQASTLPQNPIAKLGNKLKILSS
jgi:hypothetical protein